MNAVADLLCNMLLLCAAVAVCIGLLHSWQHS